MCVLWPLISGAKPTDRRILRGQISDPSLKLTVKYDTAALSNLKVIKVPIKSMFPLTINLRKYERVNEQRQACREDKINN